MTKCEKVQRLILFQGSYDIVLLKFISLNVANGDDTRGCFPTFQTHCSLVQLVLDYWLCHNIPIIARAADKMRRLLWVSAFPGRIETFPLPPSLSVDFFIFRGWKWRLKLLMFCHILTSKTKKAWRLMRARWIQLHGCIPVCSAPPGATLPTKQKQQWNFPSLFPMSPLIIYCISVFAYK